MMGDDRGNNPDRMAITVSKGSDQMLKGINMIWTVGISRHVLE